MGEGTLSSGFRERMREQHDRQRAAQQERQERHRAAQQAHHQQRHQQQQEQWQRAIDGRLQAAQDRIQALRERLNDTTPARGAARERLIEAATVLFQTRGFADVSMQDIASEVGVTKAAMYYHFTSKEQLFEVVVERTIHGFWRGISAEATAPGPFRTVLAKIVAFVQDSLAGFSFSMFEDVQRHLSPEAQQRLLHEHPTPERELQDLFRRAVAAGEMRPLDVELVSVLFMSLIFSFGRNDDPHIARTPQPGDAEAVIDIFLHGIAPAPGAATPTTEA